MTGRKWNNRPYTWGWIAACVSVALTAACSSNAGNAPAVRSSRGTSAAAGSGGGPEVTPVAEPPTCPPTNPFCNQPTTLPTTPVATAPTTCGGQAIDLTPAGVNVMVAVDGSASMNTHWTGIQSAIQGLRQSHPLSEFGLHLFWGEVQQTFEETLMKSNWCGATQNRVLELGLHTATELLSFLGNAPPGPAFFQGRYETSPVIEPLNYYLTHAAKLADPTRTNYLVFITDGNDNCFGSVFSRKEDKLLAFEKLAIELGKRNIRVVPVGFDKASMPTSTGANGMTKPNTDLDVLGTLLKFGGSGLKEVPKADDPAKLAQVIEQVGRSVRNCRFKIPAALDPTTGVNAFQLNFTINGQQVQRDRTGQQGWNFIDGDTAQVEFYGQACDAIHAAQPLEAHKRCATDVCGTAAIKVETKPRAVLLLLDASASRIECESGTLDCLPNPFATTMRTRAYWEVVEHAIGESITAPINDDIEFGLQFFPGKNAAAFSCDVAQEPEVVPSQGNEITIMSQMLEKLPLGWSPVVQVLENVASSPGRLADPNVLGSVVFLTDGGDNCSGEGQAQIVARLGAAAKKLFDRGIKTYVVRYGSMEGRTPEQDAQLRAVVANSGTATSDPTDMSQVPYIDAKNESEFVQALAAISDQLATCSFTLGNLPTDVDKTNTNLYLNGEVIAFDSAGTQQDGWTWVDAGRTSVQLHGKACTAFKTNRRTSVVVEFGCKPVILL